MEEEDGGSMRDRTKAICQAGSFGRSPFKQLMKLIALVDAIPLKRVAHGVSRNVGPGILRLLYGTNTFT